MQIKIIHKRDVITVTQNDAVLEVLRTERLFQVR